MKNTRPVNGSEEYRLTRRIMALNLRIRQLAVERKEIINDNKTKEWKMKVYCSNCRWRAQDYPSPCDKNTITRTYNKYNGTVASIEHQVADNKDGECEHYLYEGFDNRCFRLAEYYRKLGQ